MITFKNLTKIYPNGVHALRGIDMHIDDGEFVYIIGPTGSGKSTLVKILNAEEVPDNGEAVVNGVNLEKLKHSRVPRYRRSIGCIFQDYRLLPTLTVFENIAFALEVTGESKKTIRKRVNDVLDLVDLRDKAHSYPDELSGGQQQRVAIGRAIANRPALLIADEPTGNLDPEKSREIMDLLEKINKALNNTIVMVTHDSSIVNEYKKRTIMLDSGFVVHDLKEGGYRLP